uniref:Phytanoyl-CoA dioxygenase n=1 Tax=Coccolithus braarudii TaxID=221442 RepID=A0A7S0L216_9EUKA|mmetsp:Transcript_15909/g.34539  ORF Transcript_15909/g.34539 Transcript_15909/m.34539 type:complete len:325 (+) Transcript_15909:19-993(+)
MRTIPICILLVAEAAAMPLQHPGRITLTKEQLETYDRDGVVLVKGVLTGWRLRRLKSTAEGILQQNGPRVAGYRLIDFQGWRNNCVLRSVACDGTVPDLVAQVMRLKTDERLRVLKDAMLALKPGDEGCGWHVDDKFFWPCHDSATNEDARLEGVNVWITLSPLTAAEGGGLAVASRSARAAWREEARMAIAGAVGHVPNTCRMATLSPATHRRLERMKVLHQMEPGDALLHSRYCFHRSETFAHGDLKLRYSIRYMPEDARIFNNGFEAVLKAKRLQGGESLAACGEFYPQVWPRPLWRERMLIRMGRITEEVLPKASPKTHS